MKFIEEYEKALAQKINSMKYSEESKTFKISDIYTVDHLKVLPKPPENNSSETRKELKYLEDITSYVSMKNRILVKKVDKDPLELYIDIFTDMGQPMPVKKFRTLWSKVDPVVMSLKYLHNRPRPNQLGEKLGYKINVIKTDTHQSPAYPSGHTAYAAVAAHLFSAMYPKFSDKFFHRVGIAGKARCLQGVHFPSDNEAAMLLASSVWQDVRYKLFPEIKID